MLALSIIAIVLAGVAIVGVGLNLVFQLRAQRTLGQLEERYLAQKVESEGALSKYNGSEARTKVS
jgi:hypothetical protein